jgi:5-formyltetrahydrofolate cyclo-ligase
LQTLSDLDAIKIELRRKARAVRAAIPESTRRNAAERVAETGLGFLNMQPEIVAGYFPLREEFDCLPLMTRLASEGWRLALPVVHGNAPLTFHGWSIGQELEKGPRGVMQPRDAPAVTPHVLLVPLLAFGADGSRIGYGAGHYDRTLEFLRANGPVTAIGIAFDEQELPELPVGVHDEPLNWILTPSGPRAMQ